MILYILECWNQYGTRETNGYYLDINNAQKRKEELDSYPENKKHGIEQYILPIQTED